MDHAADTVPERTVAEGVYVHPDEEGPAPQVLLRDEAPVAAVPTVVSVIAHHEIVAGRDGPFALAAAAGRLGLHLVLVSAELLVAQLHTARIRAGVLTGRGA